MSEKRAFTRLVPEQIQTLFDELGRPLRLAYIEILTLLQDLLGRYSSRGNLTVFRNSTEAEALIYQALSKIEHFDVSAQKEMLVNDLGRTKLFKGTAIKVEVHFGSPFDGLIGGSLPFGLKVRPTPISRDSKDEQDRLKAEFGKVRAKIVATVLANTKEGILSIYEERYPIAQFTLARFKVALGIPKDAITNAEAAYDKLMRDVGVRTRARSSSEIASIELFEGLKKTILNSASQNVVEGLNLRSERERSGDTSVRTIDQFLDDLLGEYQLLRKPMTEPLPPQPINQQKSRKRGTRRNVGKQS